MATFWLCSNIPFNNSYDNVVGFDNQAQQLSYFQELSVGGEYSNTFRIEDDRVTFNINRNYDDCVELSYMVIKNNDRYIFAFIDTISYVDSITTRINGTVDTWQTYMFEHEILDAFIGREHQDRFKLVGEERQPRYNLEIENIELGSEYETYSNLVGRDNDRSVNENIIWYYIVTSKVLADMLNIVPLRVGGVNMGYYLYTFPIAKDGKTITLFHKPTDKNIVFYNNSDVDTILSNPNVVSIYVSPYSPTSYNLSIKDNTNYELTNLKNVDYGTTSPFYDLKISGNDDVRMFSVGTLNNVKTEFDFSNFKPVLNGGISVGMNRNINLETKLYTKPYSIFSFTNRSNEPLDLGADEFGKNIIYIESYGPQYKNIMYSDYLDNSRFFNSMQSTKNNEVPLMSDKYINYIMNNKASATTGVAISGATALAGVGMTLATGGTGMLSYLGISQAISGSQAVMNELMKRSDLKQAPRSIREVGNNVILQLQFDRNNLLLTGSHRRVRSPFYLRAYEMFLRNGYKANRFGVPNLKSRYYFNFIELVDVTIGGNVSQNVKARLERIYKNGVRIWHYRVGFNMYDYTKENWEVSLLE